jgi:serine/threonine protein kinase
LIHRDLKLENILLTENLNCKISDFGITTKHEETNKTRGVGTSIYIAPEVVLTNSYDYKCDIYSFSIIMCQVLINSARIYFEDELDHSNSSFKNYYIKKANNNEKIIIHNKEFELNEFLINDEKIKSDYNVEFKVIFFFLNF